MDIAKLTPLPYDVVLTHGHPDHIGGAAQFEEVYIHEKDEDSLKPINYDSIADYVELLGNCFLDRKERILFSGDACNGNLLCRDSINTLLGALDKIKSYESEFDRNFNGHVGYAGMPFVGSMDHSIMNTAIRTVRISFQELRKSRMAVRMRLTEIARLRQTEESVLYFPQTD